MLGNGALFPAAALALILPVFLPVAVAVLASDAIAGEANAGTLRYLLVRPVGRTRLLLVKLAVTIVFLAVLVVAAVAFAVGAWLFGVKPLPTVSGQTIAAQDATWRTAATVAYVAWSMLGVAAVALFASTVTDSPLAAALGALAALVTSQVLDLLDAAAAVQPYLPTRYPGIATQAVALTFGVLGAMLFVYKTGLVKVTQRFRAGVAAATLAIFATYMVALVLGLFGMRVPLLNDASPLGILISVAIVVVAALNLVLDFDLIERGARAGAPHYMEWYAAFGLLVTLVWLYLELLRLLAKLRER